MQADYVIHAGKGLRESFDNAVGTEIESFKDMRLFNIKTTSEWSEEFTSTEGLSGTKELSELEAPPVSNLNEGRTITLTPTRYGNSVMFSQTDWVKSKDNTTKVQEYLNRKKNALLVDVKYKLLDTMFYMYNYAFDSGATTLAPDGVELCGAHLDKAGSTWFTNKDTQAMDSGAIDTLEYYGGNFKDPQGKAMPIDFNTIIVKKGGSAAREAKKLFAFGIQPTQVSNVNIYEGSKTIIETPMITSQTAWFAYDSNLPIDMPLYVGIVDPIQMHEPSVEKNLAVTYPVTGYWKVGINNQPVNFYGSNGTT